MPDLTHLLGRPVLDVSGRRGGRLIDLVTSFDTVSPYPGVVSLASRRGRTALDGPFAAVAVFDAPAILLNRPLEPLSPHRPHSDGPCLAGDVPSKEMSERKSGRAAHICGVPLLEARSRLWATGARAGGQCLPIGWEANAVVPAVLIRLRTRPVGRPLPWNDVEWACAGPMVEAAPGPAMAGGTEE